MSSVIRRVDETLWQAQAELMAPIGATKQLLLTLQQAHRATRRRFYVDQLLLAIDEAELLRMRLVRQYQHDENVGITSSPGPAEDSDPFDIEEEEPFPDDQDEPLDYEEADFEGDECDGDFPFEDDPSI